MQRTFQSTCWRCISWGHPGRKDPTPPGRDVACCTQRLPLGEVLVGKGRLQPRDDGDFQTASEYARSEHPAKIMFRCFPSFHGIGHMECHSSFIRFSRCSWWIPHLHLTQSDNPLLHLQYRLINVQKKAGISRWISWIMLNLFILPLCPMAYGNMELVQVMGSWICSANRR